MRCARLSWLAALSLLLIPAWSCADTDPTALARRYEANLKTIRSEDDALRFVSTTIAPNFGLESSLISLSEGIAGGSYSQQIQQLINMPRMKWNPDWGMLGRYELEDVQRIVNKNLRTPVTERISGAMTKMGYGLAGIAILNELIDAVNGKQEARLSAIAATFNLMRDLALSEYGTPKLQLAMAGVGFIDYALNRYLAYVMGTHEQIWWDAYMAYMEAKYPSPLEFALLAHEQGADAVDRRLTEFWDDAELNAVEYYTKGAALPPSFHNVSGKFLEDYRRSFAARYYRDYVHATTLSYNRLMAEKARDELAIETERAGTAVTREARELALLERVFASGLLEASESAARLAEAPGDTDPEAQAAPSEQAQALAAQGVVLAREARSRCAAARAGLDAAATALEAADNELTRLDATLAQTVPAAADMDSLLARSAQLAQTAAQALDAVGEARASGQQTALAVCEQSRLVRDSAPEAAAERVRALRADFGQLSKQVQTAKAAAARAHSAALAAAELGHQAKRRGKPTVTADPAGAAAAIGRAREQLTAAGADIEAARAAAARLGGLKDRAAAAAGEGAEAAAAYGRLRAGEDAARSCLDEAEGIPARLEQRLSAAQARLAELRDKLAAANGSAVDPGDIERVAGAADDARASADTAEIFADAIAALADQSGQCLQLAEQSVQQLQRDEQQNYRDALAALERCDEPGFIQAQGSLSASQRQGLEPHYRAFRGRQQRADQALDHAEQLRRECSYDAAREQLRSVTAGGLCPDDEDRVNQLLADLDYEADRDSYAARLLEEASQRSGREAVDILDDAEQWASCPRQRQRIAAARTRVQRQDNRQARLDATACPDNAEAYWDSERREPRCRCNEGFQYDQGRGACLRPSAEPSLADVRCPPNAEAYWDSARREPRCRCYQGFQYDQARGACRLAGAAGGDFGQLLQGMLGAIEQMQDPETASAVAPRGGGTPRFTAQTIRGWWRGSCSYADAVGGSYAVQIAANGAVRGSFGGSDSGPISGRVKGSGSMRAGAGASGECTWTGRVVQDDYGRISAGGRWTCTNSCAGNWGQ